ncbi:hypothetical protein DRO54_04650 [Candidatus Bathyarchaeota archaeon]|nr:MAG: hypothetical protein DRO54_04650 [Candidatus Bathyarchaeota archaeon]
MKPLFRKLKIITISLVFLALFTLILPLGCASGESTKYIVRSPMVSRITYTITIVNNEDSLVRDVKLWVPIIRNETPYHLVLINSVTSISPYEKLESDSSNNTYLFWQIGSMFPGESFIVKIEYSVLSFGVYYTIDPALVGTYSTESKVYRMYIQPEEYVESNDPLIMETAMTIAGNETNPQKLALKIADFVSKTLVYEVQNEEKGAKWALANQRGDCSEFSYLFVALCRACGIPARIKAGFAFSSSNEETTMGHMWAEYYLPNYGWIPVDLVWGQMGYQDNMHFSSLQSFPMRHPYDNFFVEYSGPAEADIEAYQTIEIHESSIEAFRNFSLAFLAYNATYRVETAESLYLLSMMMGAKIFAISDSAKLEDALKGFNVLVQKSLEMRDSEKMQQACIQAEYILNLAEGIIFKCGIMIALIVLIITLIVIGMVVHRRRTNDFAVLSGDL